MIVEANKKILIIKSALQKNDDSKKRSSSKAQNVATEQQKGISDNNGRAILERATEADLRFLKRLKNLSEKNLRFTQGWLFG